MSTTNTYKLRDLPAEKFVNEVTKVLNGAKRYRTLDGRVIDFSNLTERKTKKKDR
jgi:hypothetical protein